MNELDNMKQMMLLVESAEQLDEIDFKKAAATAMAVGALAGAPDVDASNYDNINTDNQPVATQSAGTTREYNIVNKQADDIISKYHPKAGRKNITGTLAPHKILDNTAEGKLLSDIKAQMHQRWNIKNDPEFRWELNNYVEQQGLLYFVFHLMDTNPEHPFVIDVTEY